MSFLPEIKGCIFDLDGVLVETSAFHYRAWSRLGNEIGAEVTKEVNEQLKGISRRNSLEHLLTIAGLEIDEETKVELEEKKNNWYLGYLDNITIDNALPMVVSFLEGLKALGFKLAVGSSSKNAMTILTKVGIGNYFDVIVDGNDVAEAKPSPEIFLEAAKRLNIKPSECVVFEDAISGVQAAKRGNFKCVGIGSFELLHEADLVISSFHELDMDKFRSL